MQQTILFGNGVNLLKKGALTWDEILLKISGRKSMPKISNNTLKYEYIILPEDYYCHPVLCGRDGDPLMCIDGPLRTTEITEQVVKEQLCEELRDGRTWFYDYLKAMNADYYLTTNYENYLNELFEDKETICYGSNQAEALLYSHTNLRTEGKKSSIWNIHGSTENPSYILLGHYEYCNYLQSIQKYLDKKSTRKRKSWVNCFFKTDIHIIGFGMGYEEIDLWHILTTRKRMIRENNDINNHIYYYWIGDRNNTSGKKKLLKACGVEIVKIPFDKNIEPSIAYNKAYECIHNEYLRLTT